MLMYSLHVNQYSISEVFHHATASILLLPRFCILNVFLSYDENPAVTGKQCKSNMWPKFCHGDSNLLVFSLRLRYWIFSASIPHTIAAVPICIYFILIPSPATHRAQYLLIAWDVQPAVILLYCCRGILLYQMAPCNSTCSTVTSYTPFYTLQ